jgi:hypothetical protein
MSEIDKPSDIQFENSGQACGDDLDQSKSSTEQTIQLGQAAWSRMCGDQTWKDWIEVGAAICVGRTEAMCEAHKNEPKGRNYTVAFATWLKKYGFDKIDQGDRSRLFDVMGHLEEIEKWRASLEPVERLKANHPSTVWRKRRAATQPADKQKEPSPHAKLKAANIDLQQKLHRYEAEVSRLGGDLWSPDDRPDDIATVMVAKLSPAKADRVARAILKKLKEKELEAA